MSRISVTLVIIFKSKFSGWVEPHLYLWLGKLKAALLSKFSLYFYQTLAKYDLKMEQIKMFGQASPTTGGTTTLLKTGDRPGD